MQQSDYHPFRAPTERALRLTCGPRAETVRQAWSNACDQLRANPRLTVFLAHNSVQLPHPCRGTGRTMPLCYDWKGSAEYPGLSWCLDCSRVGIHWDTDWRIPKDLRLILEPLLAFLANPRPPPTCADCPRCRQPGTVQASDSVLPDGSLDYAVDCRSCRTTTLRVGYAAYIAGLEARRHD